MKETLRLPMPNENFTVTKIASGKRWYHVFSTESYKTNQATTFSQGWGDTRFSPIYGEESDSPVHTYYAADTIECAWMESILHDIGPGGVFELTRLRHFRMAEIVLDTDLSCVNFHTPYLAKMGLSRQALIDTPNSHYGRTRQWASAAYRQNVNSQGIAYGSRLDDSGKCIMLFKDRLPMPPFRIVNEVAMSLEPWRGGFRKYAEQTGINLI